MQRLITLGFMLALVLCSSAGAQDAVDPKKAPEKLPVSYGLVVDNSGSFRLLLDRVITVVSEVVEGNQAEDEAFFVTFVDTPKIILRQEFTFRKAELHDAAENMFIEGGQTAILDAVRMSAEYLSKNARTDGTRARALVLVTDGDERESGSKIDDVIKLLKEHNIRVYVIAMADGKVSTKILNRLTKETGGVILTPKDKSELQAVANSVSSAMRTK